MSMNTGAINRRQRSPRRVFEGRLGLLVASILLWTPGPIRAQGLESQELLRRLEALEKRIAESESSLKVRTSELADAVARIDALESRRATGIMASETQPVPSQDLQPAVSNPVEPHDHDTADAGSSPRMNIRGFGDVRFGKEPYEDSRNSFAFGQLDLYITSRLSARTSVLMETIFESDRHNALAVDVERILLQHRINRYLKLEAGRNHTAIGYYNTAFHHGTWFQTATARPFLFSFEDEGGLLPVHSVGVRASGDIPSPKLGLQYTVELGNGRSYQPNEETVQNRTSAGAGKAVNLALGAAPERVPGLRIGASTFRQTLRWDGLIPLRQTILAGYIIYDRGHVEFLNEAVWMRHTQAGRTTSIPGGYTQLAYRAGRVSPYGRFEYLNATGSDPIVRLTLPAAGVRRQASGGIRYDFTDFAAMKLQYGRLIQDTLAPANLATAQLAFTF